MSLDGSQPRVPTEGQRRGGSVSSRKGQWVCGWGSQPLRAPPLLGQLSDPAWTELISHSVISVSQETRPHSPREGASLPVPGSRPGWG